MSLGQRVKQKREEFKFSQDEVANYTNISRSNIGKIENDKINPNCTAALALSKLFKVSTDWLISGEESVISQSEVERFVGESEEEKLRSSETVSVSDAKLKGSLRNTMVEGNNSENKKVSLDLTDRERNLVLAFRQFDDFDKEMVEDVVGNIFKRLEKINQQMSYTYIPGDEDAAAEESAEYMVQKHA